MLNRIKDYVMRPASIYQFWFPQSGIVGGITFALIASLFALLIYGYVAAVLRHYGFNA